MLTTPSTLQQQLNDRRAAAMRGAPDMFAALDDNIAELVTSRAVDRVLKVGASAPDFSLPTATGGQVQLSEMLTQGPVVLTFFRGEWCPFCDLALRAFETALPEIGARGASLAAISPQTLEHSASTADGKGLSFPVLSDAANAVARSYGLVYSLSPAVRRSYAERGLDLSAFNGDDASELPIPATFVIDQTGTIRWIFVDPDFTRRPEPLAILSALDELA